MASQMANLVDPDQTAPESTVFAQTCLSENLWTYTDFLFFLF